MTNWLSEGTCETCFFSGEKFNFNDHQCRRRSPEMEKVPAHIDIRMFIPVWPIVKAGDWCGEHKPKEGGDG